MKKRIFTISACTALLLVLLAGCAQSAQPNKPEADDNTSTVTPSLTPEKEPAASDRKGLNAEAEQAYMDFLNGASTVETSEKFRMDDSEYNYDGLLYGSYTYSELRDTISELEMSAVVPKYAFLDFGSDGVNEMLLQLESANPSYMTWVGTIKYDGGKLWLNDYYEYGYRSFATLFSSGYLQIGGSSGAGAHAYSIERFDENGFRSVVFTESELYGLYADLIPYDLLEDGKSLTADYSTLLASSEFLIREYFANGTVKLSVTGLNDDPNVRKGEEAFLAEMEDLGAELISEAEMDELCSIEKYSAPEIEWIVWDDGTLPVPDAEAVLTASILSSSDPLLSQSDSHYEFIADDSEYQQLVLFSISTPVRNFRVYAISMTDVTSSGEGVFDAVEQYRLYTLTQDKPLVVALAFWGDLPTTGISFEDGSGEEHFLSLGQDGKDGSLVISPAVFNF